jgi:hypothetical protein
MSFVDKLKLLHGGPAFPVRFNKAADAASFKGMTLRDYFAAKALQGFWAADDEAIPEGQTPEQCRNELCKKFYQWADAMLEAREES